LYWHLNSSCLKLNVTFFFLSTDSRLSWSEKIWGRNVQEPSLWLNILILLKRANSGSFRSFPLVVSIFNTLKHLIKHLKMLPFSLTLQWKNERKRQSGRSKPKLCSCPLCSSPLFCPCL
jgi:hypothetical protein